MSLFTFYLQTISLVRMTNQAKVKIRLHVPQPYGAGQAIMLDKEQSHYLANVMRCQAGSAIGIFNGTQGEWQADVTGVEGRQVVIKIIKQLAQQKNSPDIWLAFAPLKNKLDVMVEKAVELGVSALLPVYTLHTVVRTINLDKVQSYIVSAAEQSGRHDVPTVKEYGDIGALLAAWPKDRVLFYGDETGGGEDMKTVLQNIQSGKFGVLIGPEGGFCPEEQKRLRASPVVRPFCMGPRILRADTAAVAALACVQAWLGDWDEKPHYQASAEPKAG